MAVDAHHRAREAHDPVAELAALNAAARCHTMRHDSIASLAVGIDAIALAQQLGDRRALAHALCAIAISTFSLKLLDEALAIAERAVSDAVALNDDDLECRARQTLGLILSDLNLLDEGRRQFELSLPAANRCSAPAFQHRVHANLVSLCRKQARLFHEQGDFVRMKVACEEALDGARAVIELARRENNEALAINMHGLRGEVFALQGNTTAAIEETQVAIEMAIRNKQIGITLPTNLRLASLYSKQRNFLLARTTLTATLQTAEAFRPTFRIAEICDAIAQNELAVGNAAAAEIWRNRAAEEVLSFDRERDKALGYLRKLRSEILATAL